jgi:hypothetical protein
MPTAIHCSRTAIPTLLSAESSEQSGLCMAQPAPQLRWDSQSISSRRTHFDSSPKTTGEVLGQDKEQEENFTTAGTTPSTHSALRLADVNGPASMMPEIRGCSEVGAEAGSFFLDKFFGKDGKDFKDLHAGADTAFAVPF